MTDFPETRLRRLRRTKALRRLSRETKLSMGDLVYPLFVTPGTGIKKAIDPMPGCYQMSVDYVLKELLQVVEKGIGATLLFGIPEHKDPLGTQAYHEQGIIQKAVRAIKKEIPDLLIITDVCLCEYTDHGHCGILKNDHVDNDSSLEHLARIAISHAQAGADMVAPSAMMDGQVKAIRTAMDTNDFNYIPIMAYSAKYSSAFYGPFRVAAESTPQLGDRQGYQMDPANRRMAMQEIKTDISEGADIVMVKPALAYLDVLAAAKEAFDTPIAAYNVSGEYSMVKAASEKEWLEGQRITMEILTAIKRAGADIIISYHAKEVAGWLATE